VAADKSRFLRGSGRQHNGAPSFPFISNRFLVATSTYGAGNILPGRAKVKKQNVKLSDGIKVVRLPAADTHALWCMPPLLFDRAACCGYRRIRKAQREINVNASLNEQTIRQR